MACVVVQVALTIFTGLRLVRARFAAGKAGLVDRKRIALDNTAWPDAVRKIGNNYSNQFELPVLFYGLVPLLVTTGLADWPQVAMAGGFVVSRIAHSAVHTGSNAVMARVKAFGVGAVALAAMWLWFAARLFFPT